jgi:hypothetical protein
MRIQLYSLALLSLIVLLLSGCAVAAAPQGAEQTLPEFVIQASEYAYDSPDQVEAGLTLVALENQGELAHHAQLARLPEGMALDGWLGLMGENPPAAIQAVTYVGGPGLLDPGLRQEVVIDLTPGSYVVVSFVFDAEGMPYLAKGMVKPFEVVAPSVAVNSRSVESNGKVELLDYSFILPVEISAGPQTWQVVNEAQEVHEVMVMKLNDGVSVLDALAYLHAPDGAQPYVNIGGFQAITPGESGWLQLDLEPGHYVAICYVPGAETGDPHFAMGMVQSFTVK